MEQYKNHIGILYGLIALLTVCVVVMGFMFYRISQGAVGLTPAASLSPNRPVPSTVVMGGPLVSELRGTITELGTNSMKIKLASDGTVSTVTFGSNTQFGIAGHMKDDATIQKELDAYNAQVAELRKDPVQNEAALAAMRVPPTQITYPAKISDFAVGDSVLVQVPQASTANATGTYLATSIIKNNLQQ
jgi:hypothetical protein